MAECIDLHDRFGDVFQVARDPAAESRVDPWSLVLLCRHGVIYPYGTSRLAAELDGHPCLARRLAALPGVSVIQDGDRERTFLFGLQQFDAVAAIIRPRRRRRLPPEQHAACRERLARFQFRHARQSDICGQGPHAMVADGTDCVRVGNAKVSGEIRHGVRDCSYED